MKKELQEMGMFAPEYKQPIPKYVHTVGIVTASTGAAIRDIIHIASRRNPYVQLLLYPAQVQGEGAVESIVRGIRMLEKKKVDVMIVGRGGGSIEDLWAFNEEAVARAVFECPVPVISAVGHETDTTIIDFVADMRAPTPSAAAELAVYDYRDVKAACDERRARIRRQMVQKIEQERAKVKQTALKLKMCHPRQKLRSDRQYVSELESRIHTLFEEKLKANKHRLAIYIEKMKGLSPLTKLSQGYSYIENNRKENIKSVLQVEKEEILNLYMTDGVVKAKVCEIKRKHK